MTPHDDDRRPVLEAGRPKRLEIIQRLQDQRKSRVVTLLISDRRELSGNLAQDILPPFCRVVDGIVEAEPGLRNLDLWIYGPGGQLDPVCAIHGYLNNKLPKECKVNVLVPYRCMSALTFLTFGADRVLMGDMGQLSPIDAQVNLRKKGGIVKSFSVEDVKSLFQFAKELLGVEDGAESLRPVMSRLLNEINPSVVGMVRRVIEHSKVVGTTLLQKHHQQNPATNSSGKQLKEIVDSFSSLHGTHGHPIFCQDARNLGLEFVEKGDSQTCKTMWELYESYSEDLDLERQFLGKEVWNGLNPPPQERVVFKNTCLALLETEKQLWAFMQDLVLSRQVHGNVNIPVQVHLPPAPAEPQQQQLLQAAVQQGLEAQIRAARQTLPYRVVPGVQNAGWTRIC